jgi:hypothetical protein
MIEIPKNRMGVVPSKQVPQPEDNGGDLRDDSESDNEEDGNVLKMSKMELLQLIRDIVLDTLKEENTFN